MMIQCTFCGRDVMPVFGVMNVWINNSTALAVKTAWDCECGLKEVEMQISDSERQAVLRVLEAGASYGFGNMIAHLNTAWARSLMQKWGMTEEAARSSTHGSGYPFKMQDDLIQRGEWDESGSSYSK